MKSNPPASKPAPPRKQQPVPGASHQARTAALCTLLFGLVLTAFWPAINSDFILYDDYGYVTANDHVQPGLTFEGIRWAFASGEQNNWHPLTWLSHMLDCQLFGLKPWGHHLTSVVLHAVATLLLFRVLNLMTGSSWRSFFVAAFFGVHPLRVESVAWVAERKDVLSAVFFMLTIGAYARYAERSVAQSPRSKIPNRVTFLQVTKRPVFYYGLSLGFFALGLMCKAMLVTLPFVLLLLDFWPLRRLQLSRFNLKPSILYEKAPFLLLAGIASAVTFLIHKTGGSVQSLATTSLTLRVENALVSYCRYLGKLVWPTNLAVFYPPQDYWPTPAIVLAGALMFSISIGVFLISRRTPYLAVGWSWFVVTLVPVIGLVQVGGQAMADRYSYLPSVGVLLGFVWGAYDVAGRWRNQAAALGAALILLLTGTTWRQAGYWKNTESLFRHALAVTKGNYLAHTMLGIVFCQQNRVKEGMEHFVESNRESPSGPESYGILGYALLVSGNPDEAIRQLQQGLALDPNLHNAHKNLGFAYLAKQQSNQALVEFQQHLKLNPGDPEALNAVGSVLVNRGLVDEGIHQFEQAVRAKPDFAEARGNLGIALCRKGRLEEAIAQFRIAVRLRPDSAEAHNNLGIALGRKGSREEAISHLKEALRLEPNSPSTQQQLRALTASP